MMLSGGVNYVRPLEIERNKDRRIWFNTRPPQAAYRADIFARYVDGVFSRYNPQDEDYIEIWNAFRLYFPELFEWIGEQTNVELVWKKGQFWGGESAIRGVAQGTRAGMRKFSIRWGEYLSRYVPLFVDASMKRNMPLITTYYPTQSDEEIAKDRIETFFPFHLSRTGIEKCVKDNYEQLSSPCLFSGVNHNSVRFRRLSDFVYFKMLDAE